MKTGTRIALVALVAAPLAGYFLFSSSRSGAETKSETPIAAATQSLPRVQLVAARPADGLAGEALTGNLVPAKALQVGFEVGGRLYKVRVQKGDSVKAGQLLGELDPEIADAQVAAASAAVLAAQAQADNAADVAVRTEKLKSSGSASEMQDKGATSGAAAAKAQLEAAKAQLAQAKAARARHELRAPFAGTIIDAPEQVGATVAPGTPLFTLEQLDPLILKITVSEGQARALRVGQKVGVDAVGSTSTTTDAAVRVVLPSADSTTHRIPVELAVPNADGRFTAHTLARARLPVDGANGAQVVPATALAMAGGDHVLVLDQGAVQRVNVEVLSRTGAQVVVRAPNPLEKVIDAPADELSPGTRVEAR